MACIRFALVCLFALTPLLPIDARAVDGVIEINQDRALAGGVTNLDGPGFPVTLTRGLSYRLTSELVLFDDELTAIEDALSPLPSGGTIDLDLNGFSIRCQTLLLNCGDGAGSGIRFDEVSNVRIRNGSVISMGSYGIQVTTAGARIHDVHAINNGGPALNIAGVRCGEGCRITDSVARGNRIGFYTDGGGAVLDSVAATNDQAGIRVGAGSLVRGCTAYDNATQGIIAGNGAAILANTIYSNGNLGIDAVVGSEFGYGQNALNDNNGGGANPQVDAASTNMGGNMCQLDAVCP